MAIAYLKEFSEMQRDAAGFTMGIPLDNGDGHVDKITFTGTAAASTAFGGNTRYIHIILDTAGYYAIGTAPTAVTATDMKLVANIPYFIGVKPGDKISLVT